MANSKIKGVRYRKRLALKAYLDESQMAALNSLAAILSVSGSKVLTAGIVALTVKYLQLRESSADEITFPQLVDVLKTELNANDIY